MCRVYIYTYLNVSISATKRVYELDVRTRSYMFVLNVSRVYHMQHYTHAMFIIHTYSKIMASDSEEFARHYAKLNYKNAK